VDAWRTMPQSLGFDWVEVTHRHRRAWSGKRGRRQTPSHSSSYTLARLSLSQLSSLDFLPRSRGESSDVERLYKTINELTKQVVATIVQRLVTNHKQNEIYIIRSSYTQWAITLPLELTSSTVSPTARPSVLPTTLSSPPTRRTEKPSLRNAFTPLAMVCPCPVRWQIAHVRLPVKPWAYLDSLSAASFRPLRGSAIRPERTSVAPGFPLDRFAQSL